jgi:predicted transcriptional regulator
MYTCSNGRKNGDDMPRLTGIHKTPVTDRVLDAIRKYVVENPRLSPSIRELQEITKISSSSVLRYHLMILEYRGDIERIPRIARGIILKDPVPDKKEEIHV